MTPFEVCEQEVPGAFAFLTKEFGFAEPEIFGEPLPRIGLVYRIYVNETTSVHVGWNDEFGSLDVILGRLRNGEVPTPDVDAEDLADLSEIMEVKDAKLAAELKVVKDLDERVHLSATLLRREAASVLHGDFDLLDAAVKLRAAKHAGQKFFNVKKPS